MKHNIVLPSTVAVLALLTHAGPVCAQKLFKYRDANGVWVYTEPATEPRSKQRYEETSLFERTFEGRAEVRLYQRARDKGGGIALITQGTYIRARTGCLSARTV